MTQCMVFGTLYILVAKFIHPKEWDIQLHYVNESMKKKREDER